jgi:hypothetical protein
VFQHPPGFNVAAWIHQDESLGCLLVTDRLSGRQRAFQVCSSEAQESYRV